MPIMLTKNFFRQNCQESDGEQKMHKKLTVGVVALSVNGQVGVSSTLGPLNPHRGRSDFPCVIWREGQDLPQGPFPRVLGREKTR
jgi:isoaspartyl peptidase/L-asparaginase-like protein (Ntn-hydrolase superfamily)